MSQSDYLNYKKNKQILTNQTDLENVLSSGSYTKFKTFVVSNTLINKVPSYRESKVKQEVNECAFYILDKGTEQRPNRIQTMTDPIGKRGYTRNHALNEFIINQKVNSLIMPCKMFQECDEFKHHRNPNLTEKDIPS